jgi:hypothetical protein
MDDYGSIKATPQNPYMGLFSQGINGLNTSLDGMGLSGLSDAMGFQAAGRLFEDMSYGSPPYRGTGFATRMSPDLAATAGAAVNLGGFAPIGQANRLASGVAGAPLIMNHSLDSVIQDMLNQLGNKNKR